MNERVLLLFSRCLLYYVLVQMGFQMKILSTSTQPEKATSTMSVFLLLGIFKIEKSVNCHFYFAIEVDEFGAMKRVLLGRMASKIHMFMFWARGDIR